MKDDFFEWFYRLKVLKRKSGNQGGRTKKDFVDIVSAFDIETTRISNTTKFERDKMKEQPEDNAVMYIWQWCFMDADFNYICIYGRTWEDFIFFVRKLTHYMDDNLYLVVYVHNLAYEFQFLRGVLPFSSDDVFSVEKRQPIRGRSGNLEFRCSYKLTNMSLRKFVEQEKCSHKKTELEYSGKRYSYTPLSTEELRYCLNDVISLCEALIRKMNRDGDNLYTIPLTSTGYVRREAKRVMREKKYIVDSVREMFPDLTIYKLLKQAFRGGNTHANRWYSNRLLESKEYGAIHSVDRSSSYPAVICNNLYPMSAFEPIVDLSAASVNEHIFKYKRAVLMRVGINHLRLKNNLWGCPYISLSKCSAINNGNFDNGRILEADYVECIITDVDYQIIISEYDGEIVFYEAYSAKYGKLPQPLIDLTIKYYKGKTTLKGVLGQEYFYMKSKNLLNSIYGMMVQDPCKDLILFENGDKRGVESDYVMEGKELAEILEKSKKKAFLNYAWGVWVTAWARYELEQGIKILSSAPDAEFLYCDTDSLKYIGDADFSGYNAEKIKESAQSGAWASDPKGRAHYMGVFEAEENMRSFVTMGAKKYAYEDMEGNLHITIAGVGKTAGAEELKAASETGRGIEKFKEGFIFDKAGGLEAVYNDMPWGAYKMARDSNGKECTITSNVCLRPTTYTLGLTDEYARLINGLDFKVLDDVMG